MKAHLNKIYPRRSLLSIFIVQVAVLAAAVPTRANSIVTWGAAQNISGDSDVSTVGTLVGAFNLGVEGVADTTVNGVTFTGLAVSGNSVTFGDFNLAATHSISGANSVFVDGPFGLSSSYKALISSSVYTFGIPLTLTMGNLVAGATYQFEWWINDNGGSGTRTTATAGNSVELASTAGAYGPTSFLPGQFAIGTFIADATTFQTITFSSGYFTEINGFQLRQTASVPDTCCTSVLFGLGLLGLAVFSQKAVSLRKA